MPQKWTEGKQAWWPSLAIPAYGRLRPEDCHKFSTSWDRIVSLRPAGSGEKIILAKEMVQSAECLTCSHKDLHPQYPFQEEKVPEVRFLDKGACFPQKPSNLMSPVSRIAVA